MSQKIKWFRPFIDKWKNTVRVSKCGRYKIITIKSGPPSWRGRDYELIIDGVRIDFFNTLNKALDSAQKFANQSLSRLRKHSKISRDIKKFEFGEKFKKLYDLFIKERDDVKSKLNQTKYFDPETGQYWSGYVDAMNFVLLKLSKK